MIYCVEKRRDDFVSILSIRYGLRKPGSNDIRFFTTPHNNNKNKNAQMTKRIHRQYLEQTVKKVTSDDNVFTLTQNLHKRNKTV